MIWSPVTGDTKKIWKNLGVRGCWIVLCWLLEQFSLLFLASLDAWSSHPLKIMDEKHNVEEIGHSEALYQRSIICNHYIGVASILTRSPGAWLMNNSRRCWPWVGWNSKGVGAALRFPKLDGEGIWPTYFFTRLKTAPSQNTWSMWTNTYITLIS